MIDRRSFIAWLAALPIVGRVVPKPYFDIPDGYDTLTLKSPHGAESLPEKAHRILETNVARLIESSLNDKGESIDRFYVVTDGGCAMSAMYADGIPPMSDVPFQGPVKSLEAVSKRCEWIVTVTYRKPE